MRKKSSILLTITVILLIGFGSTILSIFKIIKTLEYDAKQINEVGIIRGAIQRLTKLELNNYPDDEGMNRIEVGLDVLANLDKSYVESYGETVADIQNNWSRYKMVIEELRVTPTEENRNELFDISEALWIQTNQAVYLTQRSSELKIAKFKLILPVLLINIMLIVVIALLIKSYVRDQLEKTANYDALTKIYNRHLLYQVLEREINRSDRYNKEFSFILFDIDNFKRVNDSFGHDKGDLVLIELCRLCEDCIRKSDIFARFGGEEFVIVAPETGLEQGLILAEKIRKKVEEHSFKAVGHITVSVGITQYDKGDTRDSLYKRADIALYHAKRSGKNRTEINIKGAE